MLQRASLLALVFLASTTTSAFGAAVAITPGLMDGSASSSICCVVNLDDETLATTIEIVGFGGVVGASANVNLPGNGMQCISDATPVTSYCRVQTAPKKVRVTFCMADSNQNCISAVTAPAK